MIQSMLHCLPLLLEKHSSKIEDEAEGEGAAEAVVATSSTLVAVNVQPSLLPVQIPTATSQQSS